MKNCVKCEEFFLDKKLIFICKKYRRKLFRFKNKISPCKECILELKKKKEL